MAELLTRADCFRHQEQLAIALCDHCRKPICDICKIDALAVHQVYCSLPCAQSAEVGTFDRFMMGLESPFATGFRLWRRSIGTLLLTVVPVSFLISLLVWWGIREAGDDPNQAVSGLAGFVVILLWVYGVALTATVLSQLYTGLVTGTPYVWAGRRFFVWGLTWTLMSIAVLIGSILFIIPGLILSIRLFWADEFALTHGDDPIQALKASWDLTASEMNILVPFQLLAGSLAAVLTWAGIMVMPSTGSASRFLGSLSAPANFFVISLLFFVGYGMVHAPEIAKFYGMRALKIRHQAATRAAADDAGRTDSGNRASPTKTPAQN